MYRTKCSTQFLGLEENQKKIIIFTLTEIDFCRVAHHRCELFWHYG